VAIVLAAGCTYIELLFQHKNLDYFQEKKFNEDKKVTHAGFEPTHSQGGDVTNRLTGTPNNLLQF